MTIAEIKPHQLQPGTPVSARALIEASVHLPRRGSRWIATYRDGSGRQFWRSTGLTDRNAALIVAQEWESAARRADAAEANLAQPVVQKPHRSHKSGLGLSEREVALLLGMTERGVRAVQRRAFDKLRRHPALRALWSELIGEGATFGDGVELTRAEVAAVYDLARTWAERRVLDKVMRLMIA